MSAIPAVHAAAPGLDSPGSPPELTDSKSSKSSSFHSCGLPDTSGGDLSNFEDISLDEITVHKQQDLTATSAQFYRHAPQSAKGRDLTTTLKPAANTRKYQLPVPGPRTSRKPQPPVSVTSHRSRSPSPSSARNRTFSPPATSLSPPQSSGLPNTFTHALRRRNLHPRKKSVQELEKEFDELDDELPDDAVICNVPISPRPAHERGLSSSTIAVDTVLSPSSSHAPSGQTSPERSPRRHWTNGGVPVGFVLPSPTIGPDSNPDFRPVSATKSREAVFGDLNREARELTEALEIYAEESEVKYERDVQNGKISPKNLPTPSSVSTELPPLRKSDPLIDPLPVSREKEQFLTRTRPSWLPPKCRKEEKKHLKEYQKLMAKAVEAERKAAYKAQKLQLERDQAAARRAKIWEDIIQNWDNAITEPRTKELWRSGLPSQTRGEIWRRAIGNNLGLTTATYDSILLRIKETEDAMQSLTYEEILHDRIGHIFLGLKEDAATVFPDLSLFQTGGPLHESLLEVCKGFALYRSDIEWDYGIMTLVALLLVNMQPLDAFITLANIFNRPLPAAILTHEPATLATTYNTILAMIAFKRPQLHTHFITLRNITDGPLEAVTSPPPLSPQASHDSSLPPRPRSPTPSPGALLDPAVYLFPVLHGICSASSRLSIETISRIWDVIVFEGDVALIRAAVAVIGKLESRLYGQPLEILDELDSPRWDIGDTDAFMQLLRSMEHMTDDL